MKEILVIGATGYLGSRIVTDILAEGHQITIILKSQSDIVKLKSDIANVRLLFFDDVDLHKYLKESKFDIFINAVVNYGRNGKIIEVIESNIFFPLSILESICKNENLIFITFDSFYSKNPYYDNVKQSSYTLSKKHLNEWGALISCESGISILSLKLEHVVGPNESEQKFNGWIINECLNKQGIINLSNGMQIRDFILVDDIVTAVSLLITKSDLFHNEYIQIEVGTGKGYTLRNFIELIHEKTKSVSTLNFGAVQYKEDDLMYSVANNKFLLELGWEPTILIDEIVNQMLCDIVIERN